MEYGKHIQLRFEIENIFKQEIKRKRIKVYSDDEYIEICKKWINENGLTIPKVKDKIEYNGNIVNIGTFFTNLKYGNHKNIKEDIEYLFKCKIYNYKS